jgi:hypothetical protein
MVSIPRDFSQIAEFLRELYPGDPLTRVIDTFASSAETYDTWIQEEITFLSELQKLQGKGSRFFGVIQQILDDFLPVTAPNRALTNVLFVGRTQLWEPLPKKYLRPAIVRKIATVGESQRNAFRGSINHEFEETIWAVQDELRALDKIQNYMEYYYADSLRYFPEFDSEGKSAGLAFVYLALSYYEDLGRILSPYLVCLGSFEDKRIQSMDSKSLEAKIKAAKESGIRVLVLPENQAEVLSPIEWGEIITYEEGNLIDVLEHIIPKINQIEQKFVEGGGDYTKHALHRRSAIFYLNRAKSLNAGQPIA